MPWYFSGMAGNASSWTGQNAVIGEPTLADAILDRLVHNAHRLKLTGDSMRDPERNLTRSKKGAK